LKFFVTAKDEFEANLNEVMQLESTGFELSSIWRELHKSYSDFSVTKGSITKYEPADLLWVAEKELDKWIEKIKIARLENEQNIIFANIELNRWGQRAIRYGLGGLGISVFIGLIWILFIARTMVRPLRALRKGIRSITKDRYGQPIDIHAKDEFGELAAAFNDMTKRLKEEELMRAEFITTLSHEIRTPLTSIRESVNLIVEKVMGRPTRNKQNSLRLPVTRLVESANY